ncbi:MAG: DUF1549 domain-containing protein [Rubripirellula sp.]
MLPIQWCAANDEIDQHLSIAHEEANVRPSAVCDDATFLRRLSLDLIGRVPSKGELDAFLADPDRNAKIGELLDSDAHSKFWSLLWTTLLVGRNEQRSVEQEVLRAWMENQLRAQARLDKIAYALITAQGVTSLDGPVNYVVASRQDPVMQLSRTFLSVQLDCAECHDHPHDRWTNDDYQGMQRFYNLTRFREVSGGVAVSDGGPSGELPRFLSGREPHTSAWRRELGLMVIQSKPFSRAMVNRTWHWLMGRGLIDPVDGLSRDNQASVPELLATLSDDLRLDKLRLRPLIRRICESDAYQREVAADHSAAADEQRRLFATRNARTLLPEQWIASVATVLDRPQPSASELASRSRVLIGAGRQASPARDPFEWTATTQTLVRQLAGEMPAPLRDLDSTFLATLARRPTIEERRLVAGRTSQEILFAIVHGNEFTTND